MKNFNSFQALFIFALMKIKNAMNYYYGSCAGVV